MNRAARLRRLLVILSTATVRPEVRAPELARALRVSTRTIFRDLAELNRLGYRASFGNGYHAQQDLFRRRVPQPISQVMADLVDQQLQVVRQKLPPGQVDAVLARAAQFLPMEAAEAVSRAIARSQRDLGAAQPNAYNGKARRSRVRRSASSAG